MLRIIDRGQSPVFYSFVTHFNQDPYILTYDKTTITFERDHSITINGNVKDAAKAVFLYMLGRQDYWSKARANGVYLNGHEVNCVFMCWDEEFSLNHLSSDIPENFIALQEAFNKLKRLMVFS